ncbi:hypothetical protein F5888DRAFT_1099946 [Russula emetica]|nr:hypothetical protein F5888DRAFT_1099946 [Russula emetica]
MCVRLFHFWTIPISIPSVSISMTRSMMAMGGVFIQNSRTRNSTVASYVAGPSPCSTSTSHFDIRDSRATVHVLGRQTRRGFKMIALSDFSERGHRIGLGLRKDYEPRHPRQDNSPACLIFPYKAPKKSVKSKIQRRFTFWTTIHFSMYFVPIGHFFRRR